MILPRFLRRLCSRLVHRDFERDIAEEIATHRALAEADARAPWASQDDVRRLASRQMGNTTLAREDARAVWMPALLQQVVQDGRYALRAMRRSPGFTIAAISMLTVGLGVVAGGYAVANGLFFRGWEVPDSRQVFRAGASRRPDSGHGFIQDGFSFRAYEFISRNAVAGDYAAYLLDYFRIAPAADADHFYGAGMSVSTNFIEALRIPLQLGSGFSNSSVAGRPRVVISDRVWRRVFNADPAIVGRSVSLNRVPAIVIGVTEAGFDGLGERRLDVIGELRSSSRYVASLEDGTSHVSLAGRTKAGWAQSQVREELDVLTAQYRRDAGQPPLSVQIFATSPAASLGQRGGELMIALGLMGFGTVLVLLLTCANVGNLYLARCLRRQREIAIRLSLGASRPRIVRQLLVEGLVLAGLAGLGAFFAAALVPRLVSLIDDDRPFTMFAPDWRVAAFTAIGVMVTSLLVSLAPALQTTRIAWRGAGALSTARIRGTRGVLLAIQIAVATVLVLGATLVARGIQHSLATPSDFALHTTAAFELVPPAGADYDGDDARRIRSTLLLMSRDAGMALGVTDMVPASARAGLSTAVRRPGSEVNVRAKLVPMSAGAFGVLEMRLAAGRWLGDDPSSRDAVINEALARRISPGRNPIGQPIVLGFNSLSYTIVGVSRDAHLTGLDEVESIIHVLPLIGMPVLIARNDPGVELRIKQIAASIDPALTVRTTELSESVRETLQGALIGASIAGALGAVALLVAVVGIFSVFSYVVEERRREIGIRLALGATSRQVRRTMFRATRFPILGGLMVGLLGSGLVGMGLEEFLFGLSPVDPVSYGAVVAVLALAAMAATAIPIRRALGVDPAVVLKSD